MADESKAVDEVQAARATAEQALGWDPNPVLAERTKALLAATEGEGKDAEQARRQLVKYFGERISFGTAGLRSRMDCGTANMNDLSVLQASQGLAAYCETQFEDAHAKGIAIGYDHRRTADGAVSSEKLALLTAAVCVSRGYKVYLFNGLVATPLVPYAIDNFGCAAGVMVTASHNPKDDDGYKVYWANGSQIIDPHDEGIAAAIMENLEPWQKYDLSTVLEHELVVDPRPELGEQYLQFIADTLCLHREDNAASELPITYTAMHGVGTEWVLRIFEKFGHAAPIITKAQCEPDAEFPTVKYPNPEEGAGALKLAMEAAEAAGSKLILANDPDADRLAVSEQQPDGSWHVFSGNQLGLLLGNWALRCFQKANPDADMKNVYMLATTVSSNALSAMAKYHGFKFDDTLTGFKWLGNRTSELRKQGKTVLFAYEEAIGFCLGEVVKDKDGVSAAAVFAEFAKQIHKEGFTVKSYLDHLVERYGYFFSNNHYLKSESSAVYDDIFERLRNNGHYWLRCGKWPIDHVRDLELPGVDTRMDDLVPTMPCSTDHMITYYFRNGCVASIRPSGTEPKIKYYIELPGTDPEATKAELDEMTKAIISEMLEPSKHGLK